MNSTAQVIQIDRPDTHLRLVENTPTTNQQGKKTMDMGDRLRWAWSQKTGRSTAKMVLIALTEHAGEDLTAYPSIARICELTEANRKTVINSLSHLQVIGLIADTGKRKGTTGQIIVYKVNVKESLNEHSYTDVIVPKSGLLADDPSPKSTDFTRKESQKRDTEPSLNPEEIKDTPLTPQGESNKKELDIAKLEKPMPLEKEWMQDERIKQAFRDVMSDYDVQPTKNIWKLIAEPFVSWAEENSGTKRGKKKNWVSTFKGWARREADKGAWRWKKEQELSGTQQAQPEKIEYYKAPPKASAETSEQFADSLKGLLE